ncbi:transposase IS66 [Phocaeicola salanitronis DSM 18170]|uniref:Transposase IS66 n=3 Tax=Bacteroidaceae TaxID=815 RepID=F0R0G7_PHOSB|nr:IS66 family transposase [Phocaeicola salanitronis]ADY34670.1 transposase IS66 [Phocaeicola salanitronis DSM 18170]ADY35203.1 transposase IS66 [Phocaeicola salanitronis DSM 18170]ADY35305.1 transposase IS66 [Phocaeicola salanitronis DSM 18170]ADY35517.1 transposase IS66 [Phocaeicola salanitronis DSM 18170]ADY35763.1 transposase IS66 [Phocaeicola salanitronis DSM 18170]
MDEKAILLKTIEGLNASIASLSATNKKQAEQNEKLQARIKELTAQVAWLNRQLFGRKSEKLRAYDPNIPDLFADEFAGLQHQAEEKRDEAVGKIEKESAEVRKQNRQNRKMIEDLPVLETETIEPTGVDLSLYRRIGEEITKVVKHKPGMLYVKEIIRPKYALKDSTMLPPAGQKGVEIAPMPLMPVDKCIADTSLLAEILLQKYEYHVPFYRQIRQYRHLGLKGLTESTLDGWFKKTVELLKPLYESLKKEVFSCDYVQADETTIPVINRGKHKAEKEYLWMVRSVMEKLVIFHYDMGSRAGSVIESLASQYRFKGYLQCDGFAGYETAFKTNPDVRLVNCMAHIRRDFEHALGENKKEAEYGLAQIQYMYRIEHCCDKAGLSFDGRKAKRRELTRPIMEAMKTWMETEGIKYSPQSLIGKAVSYAYTRWDNMMRCLEDGRLLLDNNLAENAIRPIALGRKNYLFCGNHEAAVNMSVICSLLATCKAHDVNPRDYLKDIIAQMPYHKKSADEELLNLLPHKWKLQHPESLLTKQTVESAN